MKRTTGAREAKSDHEQQVQQLEAFLQYLLPKGEEYEEREIVPKQLFHGDTFSGRKLGREAMATLYPSMLTLKYGNCPLEHEFQALFRTFCAGDFCPNNMDYESIVENVVDQFVRCIRESDQPVFVVPVEYCRYNTATANLGMQPGSSTQDPQERQHCHENMLLYRRATNTLEHFEPHGSRPIASLVQGLELLVEQINRRNEAEHFFQKPLELQSAAVTCPSMGPQYAQELYGLTDKKNEIGLCVYWSMFVARLALMFPAVSLKEINECMLSVEVPKGMSELSVIKYLIYGFMAVADEEMDLFTATLMRRSFVGKEWKDLKELVNSVSAMVEDYAGDAYSTMMYRLEEYKKDHYPAMRSDAKRVVQLSRAVTEELQTTERLLEEWQREIAAKEAELREAVQSTMPMDLDTSETSSVAPTVVSDEEWISRVTMELQVLEYEVLALQLQRAKLQDKMMLLERMQRQKQDQQKRGRLAGGATRKWKRCGKKKFGRAIRSMRVRGNHKIN